MAFPTPSFKEQRNKEKCNYPALVPSH